VVDKPRGQHGGEAHDQEHGRRHEELEPVGRPLGGCARPHGDRHLRRQVKRVDEWDPAGERRDRRLDEEYEEEPEQPDEEDPGAQVERPGGRLEPCEQSPAGAGRAGIEPGPPGTTFASLDRGDVRMRTGDGEQLRVEARPREGGDHEVGHRENPDVLDRVLELSGDIPPEGVDEQREAGPHVGDDERQPQRDHVRARDDHGAVDVLLERAADVGIARVSEADDARPSGLEGALGGVGQPIGADQEDAPGGRAVHRRLGVRPGSLLLGAAVLGKSVRHVGR